MSKPKKTLVEGLKVEEGASEMSPPFGACPGCGADNKRTDSGTQCSAGCAMAQIKEAETRMDEHKKSCMYCQLDSFEACERGKELMAGAAQHLKREQEPTPGDSCQCRLNDAWRCAVERNLKAIACPCECHKRVAAQPPQELVSLREATNRLSEFVKEREHYAQAECFESEGQDEQDPDNCQKCALEQILEQFEAALTRGAVGG